MNDSLDLLSRITGVSPKTIKGDPLVDDLTATINIILTKRGPAYLFMVLCWATSGAALRTFDSTEDAAAAIASFLNKEALDDDLRRILVGARGTEGNTRDE